MISIYRTQDQKVVDSNELYHAIGLHRTSYSRWIKLYKNRGGENIDWFRDEKLLKLNRRIRVRYFFSLEFARGICTRYGNKQSFKLIVLLKEEMDKKQENESPEIIDLGNNRGVMKSNYKDKDGNDVYIGPTGFVSDINKAINFPLIHKFKQEE